MQHARPLGRGVVERIDERLHHRPHNIHDPEVQADRLLANGLPQLRLHQGVGDKAVMPGSLLHNLSKLVFRSDIAVSFDCDTLVLELMQDGLNNRFRRIPQRIRAYRYVM
ncbi:hypothetical protein D3C71_1313260 [compost metagenome]